MNVKMAYQFFSNSVVAGLEFFRKQGRPGFDDKEPTEKFVGKFNALADAMNSNGPIDAVHQGNDKLQIITDYLEYREECVEIARKKGKKAFLSEETDLGILVTLKPTIHLCEYLMNTVGFKHLMTARFNSDPVEQFFGNITAAERASSRPNLKLFVQLHRLLCLHSLVRPPKGSCVEGGENLTFLLNAEDKEAESEQKTKDEINELLEKILFNGETFESFPLPYQFDHNYQISPEMCEENLVSIMSGFTSFRQKQLAKNCEECLMTLTKPLEEAGSTFDFTKLKEIYMGYTYPSHELRNLVSAVEKAVRENVSAHKVHVDMFVTALKYLKLSPGDHVGCLIHKDDITKAVIKFYLTMRMFFILDRKTETIQGKKKQHQKVLVKQSKLL